LPSQFFVSIRTNIVLIFIFVYIIVDRSYHVCKSSEPGFRIIAAAQHAQPGPSQQPQHKSPNPGQDPSSSSNGSSSNQDQDPRNQRPNPENNRGPGKRIVLSEIKEKIV